MATDGQPWFHAVGRGRPRETLMRMVHRYTTLIVGAGRFARNYLQVMAQSNRLARVGSSKVVFDPLIVTRTSVQKARAKARDILRTYGDSFNAVSAEVVKDVNGLETVLAVHRPDLICITARDPHQGDRIHAEYSRLGLDVGTVLCEKPFSCVEGDGRTLIPLKALLQHRHAGRFSLHLPMAVVLQAMANDPYLGRLLGESEQVHFFWQKQNAAGDLVNDLAVHPWSLLPGPVSPTGAERITGPAEAVKITFSSQPHGSARSFCGSMLLQTGGLFRGMCFDGNVFQFRFEDDKLRVLELDLPWPDILAGQGDQARAGVVLQIENPLRQHLHALLMGHPVVDMQQTLACQCFLESARHLLKT